MVNIILQSGSSLIDMLNQQSNPSTSENNSTPIIVIDDSKSHIKETQNLQSNDNLDEQEIIQSMKDLISRYEMQLQQQENSFQKRLEIEI